MTGPAASRYTGSMALDLVAELESLVDGFDRDGVEYALCGGLAVAVHGHPRATMDIDVLVRADQLADAVRSARACGFDVPARRMTFGLREGKPREVQRVSKLDAATGELLPLDLVVAGPSLTAIWDGRTEVPWGDRRIWTVSRAGLIAMNRLAARPQDVADLAALEGRADDADGPQRLAGRRHVGRGDHTSAGAGARALPADGLAAWDRRAGRHRAGTR